MARFVLSYHARAVTPCDAFPTRTTTPRPYLALDLIHGAQSFKCYALIDSGADDCIFPASFATQLGLKHTLGRHYPYGGAGDGDQNAYFFDLEMDILGIAKYKLPIGFSLAMEKWGHDVLGQNGFFDKFSIGFHRSRGLFSLYTV